MIVTQVLQELLLRNNSVLLLYNYIVQCHKHRLFSYGSQEIQNHLKACKCLNITTD